MEQFVISYNDGTFYKVKNVTDLVVDNDYEKKLVYTQRNRDKSYKGFMDLVQTNICSVPLKYVNGVVIKKADGSIRAFKFNNSFNVRATLDYLLK